MKYISLPLLVLTQISAFASPVTPEEALVRLQAGQHLSRLGITARQPECRISEILTDSADRNTVYVFDFGKGFAVTPADDALPEVIGYGTAELYDSSGRMPEGFRDWLQYMGRCVSAGASGQNAPVSAPQCGEPIAPLCHTSWGQEDPYNLECPEYNGEKCLSGCVATAMAQVMKYHNWPPQGTGSLEYHASKIGADIYTDFSQYTFDWDNMLDDYTSPDATGEQRDAVAHLMRGLGGSVRMNYYPAASGADVNDAAQALLGYWDYSEDIRYMRRAWFTLRDWSQMLYDAMKQYGPVLYGGYTVSSGHAFVCDGYDGEGLFHFNWGWDGKADGYFAIDLLNPTMQDPPWATGYNSSQSALLNIHPRTPESPGVRNYTLWIDSYYANPATGYGDDQAHVLHPGDSFLMRGECENYGPFAIPPGSQFATVFTSLYDGSSIATNTVEMTEELGIYRNFDRSDKTVPEGLADGLYAIDNDFYINHSGWGHTLFDMLGSRYSALVENNGHDVRLIETGCIPVTEDTRIPDNIYTDSSATFQATLRNPISRNLKRQVRAELVKEGRTKGWTPSVPASFEPEETIDFTLTADRWIWEDRVAGSGEYLLCLSMLNPYGDIWIPMGPGKSVTLPGGSGVAAEAADASCHDGLYDMQGRRVAVNGAPVAPGLYIRINNGIASKIIKP